MKAITPLILMLFGPLATAAELSLTDVHVADGGMTLAVKLDQVATELKFTALRPGDNTLQQGTWLAKVRVANEGSSRSTMIVQLSAQGFADASASAPQTAIFVVSTERDQAKILNPKPIIGFAAFVEQNLEFIRVNLGIQFKCSEAGAARVLAQFANAFPTRRLKSVESALENDLFRRGSKEDCALVPESDGPGDVIPGGGTPAKPKNPAPPKPKPAAPQWTRDSYGRVIDARTGAPYRGRGQDAPTARGYGEGAYGNDGYGSDADERGSVGGRGARSYDQNGYGDQRGTSQSRGSSYYQNGYGGEDNRGDGGGYNGGGYGGGYPYGR